MRFFEILILFKNNMKFTRAACKINLKISNRDKNTTPIMILFCHYCWWLLWCNYGGSLMLWNSTWSRLKLTVQIQLAIHPCDPIFDKCNITGNSVEKHCFVVLNAKLQVKLRLNKMFYWLLKLLSLLSYWVLLQHGLFCSNFLHILAIKV